MSDDEYTTNCFNVVARWDKLQTISSANLTALHHTIRVRVRVRIKVRLGSASLTALHHAI